MQSRVIATVDAQQRNAGLLSLGPTCVLVGGARDDRRSRAAVLYSDKVAEVSAGSPAPLARLPMRCGEPGLAADLLDRFVVCGGRNTKGPTAATWRWERASRAWEALPSLVVPRVAPAVFVQADGAILVVGGVDPQHGTYDAVRFVPPPAIERLATGATAFVAVPSPIEKATGSLAARLTSGDVLVVEPTHRFELGRDVVSATRIRPDGAASAADDAPATYPTALLALPEDRAWLLSTGGATAIYDGVTDRWADGPTFEDLRFVTPCALPDGRILLAGGGSVDPYSHVAIRTGDLRILDPVAGTTIEVGGLVHGRHSPRVAVVASGMIVFGGYHLGNEEDSGLALELVSL